MKRIYIVLKAEGKNKEVKGVYYSATEALSHVYTNLAKQEEYWDLYCRYAGETANNYEQPLSCISWLAEEYIAWSPLCLECSPEGEQHIADGYSIHIALVKEA